MENLGVKTANTTDALGRSRFHCFDPETHLFGGYPGWYYHYDANGAHKVAIVCLPSGCTSDRELTLMELRTKEIGTLFADVFLLT